jgi:hypothetical protein
MAKDIHLDDVILGGRIRWPVMHVLRTPHRVTLTMVHEDVPFDHTCAPDSVLEVEEV